MSAAEPLRSPSILASVRHLLARRSPGSFALGEKVVASTMMRTVSGVVDEVVPAGALPVGGTTADEPRRAESYVVAFRVPWRDAADRHRTRIERRWVDGHLLRAAQDRVPVDEAGEARSPAFA